MLLNKILGINKKLFDLGFFSSREKLMNFGYIEPQQIRNGRTK
jgi:hypothetical protein